MSCPRREKVLIALDMTEASSRDRITGLLRHVGKMRHWEMRLIQSPSEFTPARLAAELADGVTGIIACTQGSDGLPEALADAAIPFVTVDVHSPAWTRRRCGATHFYVDDRQIGKTGANYLATTNPATFAFVPWPREIGWSSLREQAFRREVARRKGVCRVFANGSTDHEADRRALRAWLRELEKPAGIMCASDERAVQLLDVCDEPDLAVPHRIAVLGVDDDECYCDYSKPTLSSIGLDYISEGCLAAEEMERLLISRHPPKSSTIYLPYREIVERQSTTPFDPAEKLIKRVKKFIADNAFKGINVTDVAAHLGISRRLLDLRFKQYSHETVAQTIENLRLDAVRWHLSETDRPFRDIASRCGFSNIGSLRNLFRLRMGESMRDYRKGKRGQACRAKR